SRPRIRGPPPRTASRGAKASATTRTPRADSAAGHRARCRQARGTRTGGGGGDDPPSQRDVLAARVAVAVLAHAGTAAMAISLELRCWRVEALRSSDARNVNRSSGFAIRSPFEFCPAAENRDDEPHVSRVSTTGG